VPFERVSDANSIVGLNTTHELDAQRKRRRQTSMNADEMDWGGGEVTFWDLEFLEAHRPPVLQLEGLKEDLAQVGYGLTTPVDERPSQYAVVLDVGWYPEFSAVGRFRVVVVREGNWGEPLFSQASDTFEGLLGCLKAAVSVATGRAEPGGPTINGQG
jgi:hypothetical protein